MLYGDGSPADGYYRQEYLQYGLGDCSLGLAPVAIVAAAKPIVSVATGAAGAVAKVLKGIFGGTPKQKQAARVKAYAALAAQAMQGSEPALQELRVQSLGSATKDSKAAALAQYNKVVGALTAAGYSVVPTPGARGSITLRAPGQPAGPTTKPGGIPATPADAGTIVNLPGGGATYIPPGTFTPIPTPETAGAAALPSWVVPAAIGLAVVALLPMFTGGGRPPGQRDWQ